MKPTTPFLTKFASLIVATLACFDRVIFKGYLPFGDDAHLIRFIDHVHQIKRRDLPPWLEQRSEELVAHAQALAQQQQAPYEYLQGPHRKEQRVHDLIRERQLSDGLVCVLCCQENCRTVK